MKNEERRTKNEKQETRNKKQAYTNSYISFISPYPSYIKTTASAANPSPGTTKLPAFPLDSLAEADTELLEVSVELLASSVELESSNNLLLYHGNPVANARSSLFSLLSKSVVNESSV